jgi:hypothetical protein
VYIDDLREPKSIKRVNVHIRYEAEIQYLHIKPDGPIHHLNIILLAQVVDIRKIPLMRSWLLWTGSH